jgi:AcrR family transcriptional regulator
MPERRVNARPKRKRDAATTREEIVEAAIRRFATRGYERAGVYEIAADAGVAGALVNRYFGSREGLFAEVIRRALDMAHLLGRGGPTWRTTSPGSCRSRGRRRCPASIHDRGPLWHAGAPARRGTE